MNDVESKKWDLNLSRYFFVIAVAALIVYVAVVAKIRPTDYVEDNAPIYDSEMAWGLYEDAKSGAASPVEMPYEPKIMQGETAVIKTVLPNDVEDNMVITLRPDQLDMRVVIDGVERSSYSTAQTRSLGKLSCRRYIFMRLKGEDAGKEMYVYLTATVNGMGRFETLKYGDKAEVLASMVKANISDVAVGIVMFIVGIMCLIFGMVLKIGLKMQIELNYMSIMAIIASVWILCNAEISQLYFANGSLAANLDYMCVMLLPFPFLLYVDGVQKGRFSGVYRLFESICMLEIVLCMDFAIMNIFDLAEMFLVYSAVLGASLIMIITTIAIDVFKYKNYSYIIISIGILAAVVSALIQIILYAAGFYTIGGNLVGLALLIMLVAGIIETYLKVKNSEIEKRIAIAERKAESKFLANMSHEIRTPINAVLGMNEMIMRESSEPVIREYAGNIERSGDMLLSIVNDILDFSKINSGKMDIIKQNYSLKGIIDDVVLMMEQKAKAKELDFRLELDPNANNDLRGDDIRIKQIIVNLVNNAVKYTDSGFVKLTVSTEAKENDEVNLKVSVADSGRGISDSQQDKLFDAFTRADEINNRAIEGTGLGLALVKQLSVAMGGDVSVVSKFGEGSTFTVVIPQNIVGDRKVSDVEATAIIPDAKKEEGADEILVIPNARILVVDDTPMNLKVMRGLLKRTQAQVTTADSGQECIDILRENNYDVILLDHLMPGMDGEETLKVIKRENLANDTPIIALTANAIAGSREHYLEVGFDEYLSKPVKSKELEEMLRRYLHVE